MMATMEMTLRIKRLWAALAAVAHLKDSLGAVDDFEWVRVPNGTQQWQVVVSSANVPHRALIQFLPSDIETVHLHKLAVLVPDTVYQWDIWIGTNLKIRKLFWCEW